jgi:hypothetical protein
MEAGILSEKTDLVTFARKFSADAIRTALPLTVYPCVSA